MQGCCISGEALLDLRDAFPWSQAEPNRFFADIFDLRHFKFGVGGNTLSRWQAVKTRLEQLDEIGAVKAIDLSGTEVTDDFLPTLHGLRRVDVIDLHNTRVTDEGVEKLQEALPNCKIRR